MPFALLFRFDNYDEHRTHSGKNKGIGTNQMENQATHRCHYVIWTKPSHWATKIVFGPKESLVKIGPKQLLTKSVVSFNWTLAQQFISEMIDSN